MLDGVLRDEKHGMAVVYPSVCSVHFVIPRNELADEHTEYKTRDRIGFINAARLLSVHERLYRSSMHQVRILAPRCKAIMTWKHALVAADCEYGRGGR